MGDTPTPVEDIPYQMRRFGALPEGHIVGRSGHGAEGLPTSRALRELGYEPVQALDIKLLEELKTLSRMELLAMYEQVFPYEISQQEHQTAEEYAGNGPEADLADWLWKSMVVMAPAHGGEEGF